MKTIQIIDQPSRMMKISEMFGPTLQGEGRFVGRPCGFIRLALCNLDCRWCDTPYTWDWRGKNGIVFEPSEEIKKISIDEIIAWAERFHHIVISGGEPLIQKTGLIELTNRLIAADTTIEIETNGTMSPEGLSEEIWMNVSPKIINSGVPWNRAIKNEVIDEFASRQRTIYKFVVNEISDIHEIGILLEETKMMTHQVWLMPEGRSREEILAKLPWAWQAAIELGISLSPRLQVLVHGSQRGV
jgi:7-cyano-7-deazaguanosine (preQ0) biosynthesis protein QueE